MPSKYGEHTKTEVGPVYVRYIGLGDGRALKVVTDRMKLTEVFKLPELALQTGK